jgi:hypothetical protein
MDVYETIRQAIINKRIAHATYDGHRRELCPHILGKKDGEQHALCYQFAGGSRGGLHPDGDGGNWRCLVIDRVTDVTVVEGSWHTADNYSRVRQRCVDDVDVEVTL